MTRTIQSDEKNFFKGRIWLTLLLFKLSWVSLVIFRENGILPGLTLMLLMLVVCNINRLAFCLAVLFALYGSLFDAILTLTGIFSFEPTPFFILPLWLYLLWFSLGILVVTARQFLLRLDPKIAMLTGMASGCIGYGVGYLSGAVDFPVSPLLAMAMLAAIWSHFPLLWALALRRVPVTR